jgi:predicted amidohydrolase YtcJ
MAVLRRSFRDDFLDVLDRLVERGVITSYESDIDGYGPVHGIHLRVTGSGLENAADVAMLRDKVRPALANLTDNVRIQVDWQSPAPD